MDAATLEAEETQAWEELAMLEQECLQLKYTACIELELREERQHFLKTTTKAMQDHVSSPQEIMDSLKELQEVMEANKFIS